MRKYSLMTKNGRMWEKTVECFYCGILCVGTGTRDHFIPHSLQIPDPFLRGHRANSTRRTTLKDNMVYACPRCNTAKSNMSFEEFKLTDYFRINCKGKPWKDLALIRGGVKSRDEAVMDEKTIFRSEAQGD